MEHYHLIQYFLLFLFISLPMALSHFIFCHLLQPPSCCSLHCSIFCCTAPRKKVQKKRRIQRRWSDQEKEAVKKHLLPLILREKVPLKADIMPCKQAEKVLANRTWRHIRDFCRNTINWSKNI